MQLNKLVGTDNKSKKRIGRGDGSGTGKTAGKGHKGQKARKGTAIKIGFEGGQMPLYRKLPKRGFSNARFMDKYIVVNVEDLNIFDDGTEVSKEFLVKEGFINKNNKAALKILGSGELEKKLTVIAAKFSKTAQDKIIAKDGECKEENK